MCKFIRKIMTCVTVVTISCGLWACSTGTDRADTGASDSVSRQTGDQPQTSGENEKTPENTVDQAEGALTFLCDPDSDSAVSTGDGYYYLTDEIVELADGNYGTHLMYMDYASQREIYLCSTAGCNHNTLDCPAVFLYDDFPVYSTKLFVYRDALYILSREADMDGSSSQNMFFGGDAADIEPESRPAVLYRANLDGTGRKAVYTFDGALTLEDLVLGNENGILLVTKKLSTDQENSMSYTTSAERKLVCLDPDTGNFQELCSMEFEEGISWNVAGCSGNHLILYGTDYGKELSREELWNDDSHRELFSNSHGVYAALDINTGAKEELIRFSNQKGHSGQIVGNQFYYSTEDDPQIKSLDLDTGEEGVLCELPGKQIFSSLGELLCCRDWDLSKDYTWYFVDLKTGEVSHSSLVNLCNGWSLEFRADLGEDVLVINDYDAVDNGDGSYEINRYKYALISKGDLLAGRDNYRSIKMIGKGK